MDIGYFPLSSFSFLCRPPPIPHLPPLPPRPRFPLATLELRTMDRTAVEGGGPVGGWHD